MTRTEKIERYFAAGVLLLSTIAIVLMIAFLLTSCSNEPHYPDYHEYDSGSGDTGLFAEADSAIEYGFCLRVHYCTNVMPVECVIEDMWIPCNNPGGFRTCKCDSKHDSPPWVLENFETASKAECPWMPNPDIPGRFLTTSEGRWTYPPDCLEQE